MYQSVKITGHFAVQTNADDLNDRQTSFISEIIESEKSKDAEQQDGLENADNDSNYMSRDVQRIVNESSLYEEENGMI